MFRHQQLLTRESSLDSDDDVESFCDEPTQIEFEDNLVSLQDCISEYIQLEDIESDTNIEIEEERVYEDEPLFEGSGTSFHDLAALLMTLKITFNISAVAKDYLANIARGSQG